MPGMIILYAFAFAQTLQQKCQLANAGVLFAFEKDLWIEFVLKIVELKPQLITIAPNKSQHFLQPDFQPKIVHCVQM